MYCERCIRTKIKSGTYCEECQQYIFEGYPVKIETGHITIFDHPEFGEIAFTSTGAGVCKKCGSSLGSSPMFWNRESGLCVGCDPDPSRQYILIGEIKMYTQIGSCPKCGAPIYTYSVWHAITPPPSIPSCGCNPPAYSTYTSTDFKVPTPKRSLEEEDLKWIAEAAEIMDQWGNEHATGVRCDEKNVFRIYDAARTCARITKKYLEESL
jgi:hypothetical protein